MLTLKIGGPERVICDSVPSPAFIFLALSETHYLSSLPFGLSCHVRKHASFQHDEAQKFGLSLCQVLHRIRRECNSSTLWEFVWEGAGWRERGDSGGGGGWGWNGVQTVKEKLVS